MDEQPLLTRGAGLALAAALLLGVGALGLRAALEPVPRRVAAPTASPSIDFPSAEPSFDLQRPLTVTQVPAGGRVTIEGRGPRQIAYRLDGARPVEVQLACGHCVGTVTLRSGDQEAPLYDGDARPSIGARVASGRAEGLISVDAAGPWRLTLAST